jgi:hypothetical protein
MIRLLLILVALVAPVTAAFAAFDQPLASPLLASCGETPANVGFPAATMSLCPALIARSAGMFVDLSAQRLYSLPGLDSYNAAIAYSKGRFGLGGSFNSIGTNDLYLETSLGLHTAARLTRFISIGGTLFYRRVDIAEGYGSLSSISSGFGLTTELSDQLLAYAAIDNPFEPEIAAGTNIRRQFRTGVVLEDFDNVNLAMGVSLRSGNHVRYHLGEIYRLSDAFTISGGIMTAPFVPSLGCSFLFKMFALSYAYRYHTDLGGTHVWGISLSR